MRKAPPVNPPEQDDHDDASLFLVCPRCGQVTEWHDHVAVAALRASISRASHTLARPEIEISALCARCYEVSGPVEPTFS